MDPEHPASVNVQYLEQGADLIRNLDDELYSSWPESPHRGGVGAQFRHCLDFYDCFLKGLSAGRIDYSRRERDARIETDRDHAVRKAEAVCRALPELGSNAAGRAVDVKAEETVPGAAEWGRSSVVRELQFLLSHTIHHYALIAVLLETRGHRVAAQFPEFGVAPSTLAHWKKIGSHAS